ncbi:MAG: glycosyltransferase family 2 protein [Caldilineaceae bacterium]|nr:glycosyltransferase family 2 protein [Caldilineaceae bacterium]
MSKKDAQEVILVDNNGGPHLFPDRFVVAPVGRPDALPPAALPPAAQLDLSVVIPLLNEAENLELLYGQLHEALAHGPHSYEVIFIDDGSTDASLSILKRLQAQDEHLRVISFRRNFGQTAAFSAGFDFARGNVVVTMDADLQNDPADIPRLLDQINAGHDVVSGWRVDRQDTFLSARLPSQIANSLISRLTGVQLHDYGCSLKAYRREVIQNIKLYGEMHRFIPALASWMGVKVAEIPVNHRARQFGHSKYGIARTIRVILDLLTVKFLLHYATRPIQVFGLAGLVALGSGMFLSAYLTVLKVVFQEPLRDRPLLLLAVLLIVLGVQFIILGLLGELIIRMYHETRGKPIYMIREMSEDVTIVA